MTTPLTVGRDPAAEKRTREFQQRVAQILNSLILNGSVSQTGQTYVFAYSRDQNILAGQIFGK